MKRIRQNIYLIQIIPAVILTLACLFIASYGYKDGIFLSYFNDYRILLMNFIPIYLVLVLLSLLIKSVPIGFLISTLFFVGISFSHEKKVIYRSEPLMLSDFTLIKEAFTMTHEYSVAPEIPVIIAIVIVLLVLIILIRYFRKMRWSFRWGGFIIVLLLMIVYTHSLAFDDKLYMDIGKESSGLNMWVYLESYESKGISYPFIHSIKTSRGYKYKDFNTAVAEDTLSKYNSVDIADDKKVDIVLIQLESFKDFSVYKNELLDFNYDPYDYLHKLQNESIHGCLMVNSFGGGTFITETNVATGYRNNPLFNTNRMSYIWYLKNQGYKTEGSHPYVGTFYSRVNAYRHLGFDAFYDMENTFSKISDEILFDRDYFPFIVKEHENANGDPFVSLNITYQGHGPYSREESPGNPALKWHESYDQGSYHYFNNYLNLVHDTQNQFKILIDGFRKSERPVVLVMWGDHSPSMGEGHSIFKMFGINSDISTPEGLFNVYSTPYIMWANDKAKEITGNAFVGEGPTVEPAFLMNYLFRQLGYPADPYNQFLTDFTQEINVIKPNLTLYNGNFVPTENEEVQKKLKDFYNVEFLRMKTKIK